MLQPIVDAGLNEAGLLQSTPADLSGEAELDGKRYSVLRNVRETLAVYRVRNDAILTRLKRWPAELDA